MGSSIKMDSNSVALCFLFLLYVTIGSNNVLAQTEEKTFTAPKFGLSMPYPSDWTFVPQEQDFSPGIFDYSVVTPPGFASLAEFCPTSFVGAEPKVLDCQHNSPVTFGIIAFKLKDGTTLKEFYDKVIDSSEQLKRLNPTKNIETNKINVSGLAAIQTISITGGGSLDKLLQEIGRDSSKSKRMFVYLVNGSTGYQISGGTDNENDFDTYLPTIQKMINSIQIQGARQNPDNIAFVPDTKIAPVADVVLLSQRLKKGDGDYNDIVGQVKNIGSDTVKFVKIGLTVYDKNGDVVGTDSTYSDATTLEPNQKSSFDILSNKDNFDGMKSYELSLKWQSFDGTEEYVDNAQVDKGRKS